MAVFYVIAGLIVIIGNISELPAGVAMIFKMAFSIKAVGGGLCGTITAAMMNAMRYGVARGVFSNEAGMGSAAITAAAATTDHPARQGYINMTGTFWDTIVVCTITGLCIASSGVLGTTQTDTTGTYLVQDSAIVVEASDSNGKAVNQTYAYTLEDDTLTLTEQAVGAEAMTLTPVEGVTDGSLSGTWTTSAGAKYIFSEDGSYEYQSLVKGSALTILAFQSVLGKVGGWLVCIGIALFAFSTILGWEYHGEKAFEYLFGTHRYNMVYRIVFSLIVYIGATTALDLVWNFSDIANALMAIPNLICLLVLSGTVAKEVDAFQEILKKEKEEKMSNQ
jgi:AGCS family alanine or glycine:cation symporter